jgi:hypothetical protein
MEQQREMSLEMLGENLANGRHLKLKIDVLRLIKLALTTSVPSKGGLRLSDITPQACPSCFHSLDMRLETILVLFKLPALSSVMLMFLRLCHDGHGPLNLSSIAALI